MLTRDRLKYIGLLEEIEEEASKVNWDDPEEDIEQVSRLIKKIEPTQAENEETKLKLEKILDIIGHAWERVPTSRKIAENLHNYYIGKSLFGILSLVFKRDEGKVIGCEIAYCISYAATLRKNYELSGEQRRKFFLQVGNKNQLEQIEEFLRL